MERLIEEMLSRFALLMYELTPNYWHFVVKPRTKEELSCFFQYLSGTHGKRFRADNRSIGQGHVYQGRFKSFPVQSDEHFLSLCRYVERNALRAGLVDRAEQWKWSALYRRLHGMDHWLHSDWPVRRPRDWVARVNQPLTEGELQAIRRSIRRGRREYYVCLLKVKMGKLDAARKELSRSFQYLAGAHGVGGVRTAHGRAS